VGVTVVSFAGGLGCGVIAYPVNCENGALPDPRCSDLSASLPNDLAPEPDADLHDG
jgi:hypothetical protein